MYIADSHSFNIRSVSTINYNKYQPEFDFIIIKQLGCIQTLRIRDIHDDVLRITSVPTTTVSKNHGVDSCTSVRPSMAELNIWYLQYWTRPAERIVTDLGPFILDWLGVG